MMPSAPLSVLAIEDDADDAELTQLVLRSAGFAVTCDVVQSVAGMVTALERGSYDVVVSDCSIPGFTVGDALHRCRSMTPQTPFILVSGAIGEADAVALMGAGAADYVPKSHLEQLPEAIRRALTGVTDIPRQRSSTDARGAGPVGAWAGSPAGFSVPAYGEWRLPHPPAGMLAGALVFACYLVLAEGISLLTAFGNSAGASFWPAAGLTVAALLRRPRRDWPWILVGVIGAEVVVDLVTLGLPLGTALGWGLANVVEPTLSVWLLQRWAHSSRPDVDKQRGLRQFLVTCVMIGPIAGALIGGTTGALTGLGPWWTDCYRWWIGDSIGVLVVAPVLLMSRPKWAGLGHPDPLRALLVVTAGSVVLIGPWPHAVAHVSSYLALALLILVAVRENGPTTAVAVAIMAVVIDVGTAAGYGEFGGSASTDGLLAVQFFLATAALSTLVIATLTNDLVRRDALEAVLREQAMHDGLTGLGNRRLLNRHIETLTSRRRGGHGALGLLFIDLDGFKTMNDLYGHAAGDLLLIQTAERLTAMIRERDAIARLGGDEFLVLLDDVADREQARRIADQIAVELSRPVPWGAATLRVEASIGIALSDAADPDVESLLFEADQDMYTHKQLRAQSRMARKAPTAEVNARLRTLRDDLVGVLARAELEVHFQPILDLDTGEIVAAEALLRWTHPRLGPISPAEFIPLAEKNGQILELGRWVLLEACYQAATWNRRGPAVDVHVNVSPQQLGDTGLEIDLADALARSGLNADRLVLEITESSLAVLPEVMTTRLRSLKALGVHIAMDDFGTGYSSLSTIAEFPLDLIKIDKSFVTAAGHGTPTAVSLLSWVVTLGNELGITLVGEGVETEAERQALRTSGCRFAQGFLFARPLTTAQMSELLEGSRAAPTR